MILQWSSPLKNKPLKLKKPSVRDRYTLLPKKNYKIETDEETVPGIAPPELLDTDKLFEELPMEKFAEGNLRKVRKMTRKHKIGQRVMKLDKDQ